jgi:hypothetical protein
MFTVGLYEKNRHFLLISSGWPLAGQRTTICFKSISWGGQAESLSDQLAAVKVTGSPGAP